MAKNNKNDKVFGKYTKVSKRVESLETNEITSPKQSGRYKGTSEETKPAFLLPLTGHVLSLMILQGKFLIAK